MVTFIASNTANGQFSHSGSLSAYYHIDIQDVYMYVQLWIFFKLTAAFKKQTKLMVLHSII